MPLAPFNGIAIVGEAPGADEVKAGCPFVGDAGKRLNNALENAGIDRSHCLVINPFRFRPEGNKITNFFASHRAIVSNGWHGSSLPANIGKKCLVPHDQDVAIMWKIIEQVSPRILVALGNTAMWALTHQSGGVTSLAGTTLKAVLGDVPVLVTYHPSYVNRNRSNPDIQAAFDHHLAMAVNMAR
jgi:DNA polymerase